MQIDAITGLSILFADDIRIDESGCWRWLGEVWTNLGGKVYLTEKSADMVEIVPGYSAYCSLADYDHIAMGVRRYVAMAKYADYKAGWKIEMMCGVEDCCNPDHLYAEPKVRLKKVAVIEEESPAYAFAAD